MIGWRGLLAAVALAILVVSGCHRGPREPQAGPVDPGCTGSSLEWSSVLRDCACSSLRKAHPAAYSSCPAVQHGRVRTFAPGESPPPSASLGLRGTVTPGATLVHAGSTLALTVRFENSTANGLRMTLREPAGLMVYDDAPHGGLVDVDDPSRTSADGDARCEPTEVGVTEPNQDPAVVTLDARGVLTETLAWHAARARRDMGTCGWRYEPLAPGRYLLWILWPESSAQMAMVPVTVVP